MTVANTDSIVNKEKYYSTTGELTITGSGIIESFVESGNVCDVFENDYVFGFAASNDYNIYANEKKFTDKVLQEYYLYDERINLRNDRSIKNKFADHTNSVVLQALGNEEISYAAGTCFCNFMNELRDATYSNIWVEVTKYTSNITYFNNTAYNIINGLFNGCSYISDNLTNADRKLYFTMIDDGKEYYGRRERKNEGFSLGFGQLLRMHSGGTITNGIFTTNESYIDIYNKAIIVYIAADSANYTCMLNYFTGSI